jgi:hypothetical protein
MLVKNASRDVFYFCMYQLYPGLIVCATTGHYRPDVTGVPT